MKSRVAGVPNKIKVDVFYELENYNNTPESLHILFMNQLVENLDHLSTSDKVGTV